MPTQTKEYQNANAYANLKWTRHDFNASSDDKIEDLISQFGPAAYGLYWFWIETLGRAGNRLPKERLLRTAWRFGGCKVGSISEAIAKQMLDTCLELALLIEKDGNILSSRLEKEFSRYNEISTIRAESGKKGGESKRLKDQAIASVCHGKIKRIDKNRIDKIEEKKEEEAPGALVPVELFFPDSLNSVECRKAWGDWIEHKRSRGQRYKSTKTQQIALNKFASLGAARFIAAVQHSIANNWSGVFEEHSTAKARQAKPTTIDLNKALLNEVFERERSREA